MASADFDASTLCPARSSDRREFRRTPSPVAPVSYSALMYGAQLTVDKLEAELEDAHAIIEVLLGELEQCH